MHPSESLLQAGLCILGWLALGGWLFKWARGFLKAEAEAHDRRATADRQYSDRLKEALDTEIRLHERTRQRFTDTVQATDEMLTGQVGQLSILETKCHILNWGLATAGELMKTRIPTMVAGLNRDIGQMMTGSAMLDRVPVSRFVHLIKEDAEKEEPPQDGNELLIFRLGVVLRKVNYLSGFCNAMVTVMAESQAAPIETGSQLPDVFRALHGRLEAARLGRPTNAAT